MWRGTEATKSAISSSGSAVEVGLFGLQTIDEPRGGGDLARHRVEVVAVVGVDRHLDRARARRGREVRVDAEARPGVDDLGARLEQRLAGGQQDVARAVADRDRGAPARRSGR